MSNDYKKEIMDHLRDEINKWIDVVKKKYPEKLITKQWQILFPKGYTSGHNVMPVVTGCKDGQFLIGEVQFVLPSNLDLSLEDVELVLKEEPYAPDEIADAVNDKAVAIDDSIDVLNNMVCSINEFINSMQLAMPNASQMSMFPLNAGIGASGNKVKVKSPVFAGGNVMVDDVRHQIENSPYLPDWIKNIDSTKIHDEVIEKLTTAFKQHGNGDVKGFFEKYEKHLLNHGHLHWLCTYKGKSVVLDEQGRCMEDWCSKKPYNAKCKIPVLRFGGAN